MVPMGTDWPIVASLSPEYLAGKCKVEMHGPC